MNTKSQSPVVVDGERLTLDDVLAVARDGTAVRLDPAVPEKIRRSREYVERAVACATDPHAESGRRKQCLIYGVTTGFGCHKDYAIQSPEEARRLQANILLSHACGVGPPLSPDVVRAVLLLRLNSFAKGHSGVRIDLLEFLSELLNECLHPFVPEQGSVGSSGDLCPLAHAALVLIGRGQASFDTPGTDGRWERGEWLDGTAALERIRNALSARGIPLPFSLDYKEGLALTNGATVMTAIGALAYADAVNLIRHADAAGAMTLEAIGGRMRAFDPKVHALRPFPGQTACADNVRRLVDGSTLVDRNGDVHDAYSVRCMPQVHGAVWDALEHVRRVLEIEMRSATDNPLFLEPDPKPFDGISDKWDYSAGNFHGEPVALAMDFLALALAELGSISERRIQKMLDRHHNYGLPSNLAPDPSLHSGLMLSHYTAAALVSENKVLCHPASCDSIPTSANIEDHVSMGTVAARKARAVLENVENVIAVELLCASQALDFRTGGLPCQPVLSFQGAPGKGTGIAHETIRKSGVKPVVDDRELAPDIAKIKSLIESGRLLEAVQKTTGALYHRGDQP